MKRLTPPAFDAWDVTVLAASKFHGTPLNQKVMDAEEHLKAAYLEYNNAAHVQEWHTFAPCLHAQPGQIIVADLSKAELGTLYSDGLVKGFPDARDIYDQIKVAAEGQCPYCGGIGSVDPLDHFLPKARFPQFSVLPANLVPSCDRCNKLAGTTYVNAYEDQTINPYFDHARFFDECWIAVEFPTNDILTYLYTSRPPLHWPDVDRQRANTHFRDFRLGERYAAAASSEVSYLATDFMAIAGPGGADVAQELLRSRADSESFVPNGWQRPLYRALSESPWYLAAFA